MRGAKKARGGGERGKSKTKRREENSASATKQTSAQTEVLGRAAGAGAATPDLKKGPCARARARRAPHTQKKKKPGKE